MTVKLKKESYQAWLARGTHEAADGYWQAKRAAAWTVAEAKTRVWEKFGEAMGTTGRPSSNTVYGGGGELLTSTGDIVGQWKEYFQDLLNPTDTPSIEEAEAGDSEVDPSITQAEVNEVVRKFWFGSHWISSLLVKDDVVLLAPSSQDLRFATECEAAGMKISTSKSEAMVLDRKKVACSLRVGGEFLPHVEEFKYLGVLFTSEGRMEREIDRRIGSAAAVMRSLYWSVMVKRELSRKVKISI